MVDLIVAISLMDFLDEMYKRFDAISDRYGLYKVEIIGDAYFVVGGCPVPTKGHTEHVVRAAHEMLQTLPELRAVAHRIVLENDPSASVPDISIRVGVHVGPVVAGIVGFKDPRYHVFGETVAMAEMMESKGVPGRIHCSKEAKDSIQAEGVVWEARAPIDLAPLAPEQVSEQLFYERPKTSPCGFCVHLCGC